MLVLPDLWICSLFLSSLPALSSADPAAQKELQTKELNNGRLAMIAIAAFVVSHHPKFSWPEPSVGSRQPHRLNLLRRCKPESNLRASNQRIICLAPRTASQETRRDCIGRASCQIKQGVFLKAAVCFAHRARSWWRRGPFSTTC